MRWHSMMFACLVACGGKSVKTPEELANEHGVAIKAKLEAIKAAGAAGLGASDDPSVKTVPGLDFETNALVTMYDDTQDPGADPKADRAIADMFDRVRMAKKLLGVKSSNAYQIGEAEIAQLENAKYVLVVYRSTVSAPRQALSGDSFTPGAAQSANVLVELGTNKVLGSFTTQAVSSDKVTAKNVDGHAGATEAYQSYLDADLREQWGKAVADGVAKRWPGAKTPYKF
jgi:hypothetical protein